MEFKTLEDYVGHTPLVRLKRIGAGRNNVILAKVASRLNLDEM